MSGSAGNDKFFDYFVKTTEKKFDALQSDIAEVNSKLQDLHQFKTTMIVNSRWVSIIVSAVCGAVTLGVSTAISLYTSAKERQALLSETTQALHSSQKTPKADLSQ